MHTVKLLALCAFFLAPAVASAQVHINAEPPATSVNQTDRVPIDQLQSDGTYKTFSATVSQLVGSIVTGPFTSTTALSGTLPATPAYNSPSTFNLTDTSNGANNQTISALLVNGAFYGNGTQISGARTGLQVNQYIDGPSAQTGFTFKQYVGILGSMDGTAGDGSIVTTSSGTCTTSTCTNGTVIPVTATSATNGIYTQTFHVGDAVGFQLDAGGAGIGPTNYFSSVITAVTPGVSITIAPGIPSTMTSGAMVFDLTPAASMWGIMVTTQNNPNGTVIPSDPPSNLFSLTGEEQAVGSTTYKIWNRFGYLAAAQGNQAGNGVDGAFVVGSGAGPNNPAGGRWLTGLLFSTVIGGAPIAAGGTAIRGEGTWSVARFIDFGKETCTDSEIVFSNFVVDCGGSITASNGITASGGNFTITRGAGTTRSIFWQTGTTPRWVLSTNSTAESGSNAGSDWSLSRYNDAGTIIDIPILVTRSSGLVTLADGINSTLPTSAGAGGIYVCVDSSGTFYKKASCP